MDGKETKCICFSINSYRKSKRGTFSIVIFSGVKKSIHLQNEGSSVIKEKYCRFQKNYEGFSHLMSNTFICNNIIIVLHR